MKCEYCGKKGGKELYLFEGASVPVIICSNCKGNRGGNEDDKGKKGIIQVSS